MEYDPFESRHMTLLYPTITVQKGKPMQDSFDNQIAEVIEQWGKIDSKFREIRLKYEHEKTPQERQKLIKSANRLIEEVSGIKFREQAENISNIRR